MWEWSTPMRGNILSMTSFKLMVHGDSKKQSDFAQFHYCAKVSTVNAPIMMCTRNRLIPLPCPWLAAEKKPLFGVFVL